MTDIRLGEELAEIVVWPSKPAIKDTRQGCLRISAIGTGMLASITEYELQESGKGRRTLKDHQHGSQTGRQIVGYIIYVSSQAPEITKPVSTIAYH